MIQVDFRGKKYPCMGNYHYYLSGQYGDYMIPPPEKDRITHDIDAYLLISNNCSDYEISRIQYVNFWYMVYA